MWAGRAFPHVDQYYSTSDTQTYTHTNTPTNIHAYTKGVEYFYIIDPLIQINRYTTLAPSLLHSPIHPTLPSPPFLFAYTSEPHMAQQQLLLLFAYNSHQPRRRRRGDQMTASNVAQRSNKNWVSAIEGDAILWANCADFSRVRYVFVCTSRYLRCRRR